MSLRILHLEDNPRDAELAKSAITNEGLACEVLVVANRSDFLAALDQSGFDLILSDFSLPSFDGHTALVLAHERCPSVPFIFISGTIGEERAIEALKSGATDYVLKDRLPRLGPAVRRALREAEQRAERVRMEEQIREQAALLDVAQEAILVCNLASSVLFWNKGAERLYGWPAAEAIGKEMSELIQRAGSHELEEARNAIAVKGEWSGETQQVTRAGKELIVESRWTLVRDAQDNPKSILIINTDITGKKQLEAQFLRAQRLESLGTLASGIAHDLNNVLAPILMATQLLQLKRIDAESQQWLEGLAANTRRGVEMVRQVVTFARGAEGERGPLQIKHLIVDLERILKDTFPRSIQITSNAPRSLWTIVGNSTQLYQVMLNLCVNARDAMPRGGRLSIELDNAVIDEHYACMYPAAHPGRYLVLTVSDTGTGIPPHMIDKIFDPFFTTKEMGKGTGLGLSTVVGIVKGHGGFVTVNSEVGKGSHFKVYLPAESTHDITPSDDTPATLPSGHGEMVLVVDDEDAIVQMTTATLVRYGYRVLAAKDGAEAVAVYAQHREDIRAVLTDLVMPFMDGAAVIRALRKLDPAVNIIVVSGLSDSEGTAQMAGGGAVQYLQKPYSMEQLLTALAQAVSGTTAA